MPYHLGGDGVVSPLTVLDSCCSGSRRFQGRIGGSWCEVQRRRALNFHFVSHLKGRRGLGARATGIAANRFVASETMRDQQEGK